MKKQLVILTALAISISGCAFAATSASSASSNTLADYTPAQVELQRSEKSNAANASAKDEMKKIEQGAKQDVKKLDTKTKEEMHKMDSGMKQMKEDMKKEAEKIEKK